MMSEKLKPCPFCGEQPHVFFASKEVLKFTERGKTWKYDMHRIICPNNCCMQSSYDDGYECENVLREDALAHIQQLEREKEELVKNKLLSEGISLDLRKVVKVCEGELLVAALNMISDMQAAAPKWISVEDRLPEDDLPEGSEVKLIKVLVAIKAKNGVTVRTQTRHQRTLYDTRREPFFDWEWRYSAGKVTHWMKLPEPPKGVE